MPTYGIMHDDGTFEPLNQQQAQQQIPQPNWRYRPANVYGNRVIAGMQHSNGPRYSGTQVRTTGGNYQQQLPAGAAYPLQNNLYYGPGAPVAQRWYGTNPNVSTVYGGYGYNAPQTQAVAIGQNVSTSAQQSTPRTFPRITQRVMKQRVAAPGVVASSGRTIDWRQAPGNLYPQPAPVGVYPVMDTGVPYYYPQPLPLVDNNYYADWQNGQQPAYVPFSRAQQAISESWERPISRHPAAYGSRDLSKNVGVTMGLRQPRDAYEAQLFADSARLGQTQLDTVKNAWNTVKNWFAQNPRYEELKMTEDDFNARLQDMDRALNWASTGIETVPPITSRTSAGENWFKNWSADIYAKEGREPYAEELYSFLESNYPNYLSGMDKNSFNKWWQSFDGHPSAAHLLNELTQRSEE